MACGFMWNFGARGRRWIRTIAIAAPFGMGDLSMYACCNDPVTRKSIKGVCDAAPFAFPWGLKQRIGYEKGRRGRSWRV
jgi:hypothetical protein